jgi:uncharacterized protein (TIGR02284 family)
MTSKSNEMIKVLNSLIEVCKDSEKGFREAAIDVRDDDFKETFLGYARRVGHFGTVLQDEVRKLGVTPRDRGSVLALLHRARIHLRAILNWHDAHLMLLECERGEKRALDTYGSVLEMSLMPDVKSLIEKQFVELIEMSNHMREMETEEKPVHEESGELLHLH